MVSYCSWKTHPYLKTYLYDIWFISRYTFWFLGPILCGAMPSRLRHQLTVRRSNVKFIVSKMVERLRHKTHRKRMETTNRILPMGSLKKKQLKNIFNGWILELEGRVLTKQLAQETCDRLRKKLKLGPNDDFREDEIKRVHAVLKGARKRQLGKPAMSSMDNVETLPLLPQELLDKIWEDPCFNNSFRFVFKKRSSSALVIHVKA